VDPSSVDRDVRSIAEEAGERVRRSLQDDGYFKADVDAEAVRVTENDAQYDIQIMIRSPYTQFRLGDVTFVNATYFSTQQLRDLIHVHTGEIFDRQKIEDGLANLRRLYGSQGFVNYTGVPETHFDDENASVNLTVDVAQGKQFHVRSIDVLGVDPETKANLLDELSMKPGDLYNPHAWEPVFLKFPNLFPNPNPDAIGKTLDERNGQVDVLLDLRKKTPCPALIERK
jgi:outer membrane protein assembly factor BamA